MRVAFVHYHLNPGGVTTVIRQQVRALRKTGGEAMVITGSPAPAPFPVETVAVTGIGYSRNSACDPPGERVAKAVAAAIRKRWPGGCDVIHVHNPTLAKNIRLPAILETLQDKGFRLLLQIHDFAEDGRPDVYSEAPYPRDCHYAVINSRDYRILLESGLKKEGLHLLPNMVSPVEIASHEQPEAPFILYPVRAIRRKNIGEAILLSLFIKAGGHLAVTLPPGSPVDVAAHGDWKLFTEEHRLPVRFDTGLHGDFSKLAAAADCFITTSITEGFGFSFLEPWTAGKALQGRKLPDICNDFEARGIVLDDLYSRLSIPVDWFDRKRYLTSWRTAVERVCDRFGLAIPPSTLLEAEIRLSRYTEIDFGLLNEKYQREVLRHLLKDPGKKAVLKQLNPFLEDLTRLPDSIDRIRRNREIVLSDYSFEKYRGGLQKMYERVAGGAICQNIHKEVLLSRFLDLDRLSLLKWGAYET